jgi:hypothetical protein
MPTSATTSKGITVHQKSRFTDVKGRGGFGLRFYFDMGVDVPVVAKPSTSSCA